MADVTVAVVIPTIGRAQLDRAVDSVRRQTRPADTIVIVVDDPLALPRVEAAHGADCLVVATPGRVRGAAARNLGMRATDHDVVMYLDDDDWWDEDKIARQLPVTLGSGYSWTYTNFHGASGERLLPKAPPRADGSMAGYLVTRRGLRHGDGYIQSSSLAVERPLAEASPWDEGLAKHQDWDYVVRLAKATGTPGGVVPEPLVHVAQGSADSVSARGDTSASRYFLQLHGAEMPARARADFVATQILRPALRSGDLPVAREAVVSFRRGLPHWGALIVGVAGLVEYLRSMVERVRGRGSR